MKKQTKYLLFPAAVLVWSVGSTSLAVDRSMLDAPRPGGAIALSAQAAGQARASVLIATTRGQATAAARHVSRLGGQVGTMLDREDFLVARVPAASLAELQKSPAVRAVALDKPVKLDPTAMQPLDEQAPAVPSASDPALSLRITRAEIRAPQFTAATGGNGEGSVIAILDTGVDPSHPALQKTAGGVAKIVDWQDFTGEGDVATTESRLDPISGIPTQSGTYRMGQFKESQIPSGEMNSDINRNGTSKDVFGVLLTDATQKGVYDTAYVDTNANGDFSDEEPMGVYRDDRSVGLFGSTAEKEGARQGVSFVVTRINADGSGLNLGYDGGQHGTHVAGISAGTGPMTGVAPGARVMAIKVLNSGGTGSWEAIVKGMEYAASHGASVINMSLGGQADLNDGNDPQSLLVRELSDRYGVLFSIAAGNAGPGLNTTGLPGVAGAAITSGAYISSNTWKADYGLTVPQDGLWYFSSAGPRDDGGLKPNIVAPGTANSSIPLWAGKYAVFQGTSMATPQTTGAIALLVGEAKHQGMKPTPKQLISALETGARRLPGYAWFEQGHGLIQVDKAWEALQTTVKESNPDLASFGRAKTGVSATGLYARDFTAGPEDARWTLGNRELLKQDLNLTYLPGNGLTVSGPARISLPSLQRRQIPFRFGYAAGEPGVYDALIQAAVPGHVSAAAEYLATVVVPHTFDPARGNIITGIEGVLSPARYDRHFVRVPEGTAQLTVNLTVPNLKGRVRLMAFTPDGMPSGGGTPWAGAPDSPERQTLTVENPQPGVWEVDAYASHGGMNYRLAENHYAIDMEARGVYATPSRVALAPMFGGEQTRNITFVNYFADMQSAVAGVGFAQPVTERPAIEAGGVVDKFLDVAEGTALLRVTAGRAADPTADLDFGLYYNDPRAGGWVAVGKVTGDMLGRTVELAAPAPGQYAVEVVARTMSVRQTSFDLRLVQVRDGAGLTPSGAGATVSHRFGDQWTVAVKATLPGAPGAYVGAVTLTDKTTGKVLTVVPFDAK